MTYNPFWPSGDDSRALRVTVYVFLAMLIFCLFGITGCSPIKKLDRSIARVGQKESVAHILAKYGEYVPKADSAVRFVEIPPIYIDRPVLIADTSFDSALDSFRFVNEWLTLELGRYQGAFFKIKATQHAKRDTVYLDPIETFVEGKTVYLPCPDADVNARHFWEKSWFIGLVGIFGIALALFFAYKLIMAFKPRQSRY